MKTHVLSFSIKVLSVAAFCLFASISMAQNNDTTNSQNIEEDELFGTVETMPTPIGGEQAFLTELAQHLKYDRSKLSEEFMVYLSFQVNTEGEVSDIKVIKGNEKPELAKAAVAALEKTTTKWKPGMIHDKPIATEYYLPITFMAKK